MPETLEALRAELDYWEPRQHLGDPGSIWWQRVGARIESLRHRENRMLSVQPPISVVNNLLGPNSRINHNSIDQSTNLEQATAPTDSQRAGSNEAGTDRIPFTVEDLSEFGGLKMQGYKVYQALALSSFSNDVDGWALMLIDERLHGLEGGMLKDPYSELITLHLEFDPEAPRHPQGQVKQALLLVVDERARILYSEQLGRESARLDRIYLYQDRRRPSFIVTRDYSIGMGSYNGPISYLLEISAEGIRYIFPYGLMTSLKTAWAVIDRRPTAEVIYKKCRPNFRVAPQSELDFEVVWEHFYLEDDVWKMESHREPGFWEYEKALEPSEFRSRFSNREHT